jgi:hypothetical protein
MMGPPLTTFSLLMKIFIKVGIIMSGKKKVNSQNIDSIDSMEKLKTLVISMKLNSQE